MNRRHFIRSAAALPFISAIAAEKPKRLILRSSWQTVNIGDIAHTPGVLTLLEKHLPDVEVRLWPSKVDNGVEEMLNARFPKVKIIRGEEVKKAFEECDFLLHGSGPSLVAQKDVKKWSEATGKPYGIYGITFAVTDSTSTQSARSCRAMTSWAMRSPRRMTKGSAPMLARITPHSPR
jgi:hypothetical protein